MSGGVAKGKPSVGKVPTGVLEKTFCFFLRNLEPLEPLFLKGFLQVSECPLVHFWWFQKLEPHWNHLEPLGTIGTTSSSLDPQS